jgi:hypothetical protein
MGDLQLRAELRDRLHALDDHEVEEVVDALLHQNPDLRRRTVAEMIYIVPDYVSDAMVEAGVR